MKRIFLVGAPRSGTTMLQSLLASHPSIISFPETKFFHYLLYEPLSQSLPDRLKKFFIEEIKRPELLNNFCGHQSDLEKANCFIKILDNLAEEQDKCIWLEKTPEHLYFIDYLENLLPDALFIHILRNGIDVIASMYEASRKSPEAWGGIWDLDFCIKRWQEAISISNPYLDKHNHILVRYEGILENPQMVLSEICQFIQVDFDEAMLSNYKETSKKLSLEAPWHQGIDRDIQPKEIPKYQRSFNKDEIEYISQKIEPVTVGITDAVPVEVTEPISDIHTPG
ncbi:MAG: sulfotransferase [Cyanobacteriota bacterium]|nr:sulfotransferase [Cyanobacteriota bacterium]